MRRLPRPNEEIFDTGEIWTPDRMPEALDAAFTEIEGHIGGVGGGGAFDLFALTGRIQTTSTDHPPTTTPSPALAIRLPVGFTWLQDGQVFAISEDDGPRTLTGVPANFTGYLKLSVTLDSDGEETWALTSSASRAALGSGTLARVETDADSVNALDPGPLQADVIAPLATIIRRLQVLEAGTGGGGEGGGGGAAAAELLPWQVAPGDERDTVTVVKALDDALAATLRGEIAAGGKVPVVPEMDFYAHRQAVLIMRLGKIDTAARDDFEGASMDANVGGDGTADTENHVGPTTMTKTDRGWTP